VTCGLRDLEKWLEYISLDSTLRAGRFAARLILRMRAVGFRPESVSWIAIDCDPVATVWIVANHHCARIIDLNCLCYRNHCLSEIALGRDPTLWRAFRQSAMVGGRVDLPRV
jgi:hypothetical protein